jgi:DNA-binding transcriptional ArsR family regulator
MNAEIADDLERRAEMHAALADPARLAITGTLADGDASPSELAAMLAMPSNLLAHHLRVGRQAPQLPAAGPRLAGQPPRRAAGPVGTAGAVRVHR